MKLKYCFILLFFITKISIFVFNIYKHLYKHIINIKNSIISLPSVKKNDEVIIKYQYLNNGLPIKIGPKWKDLPKINNSDSLVVEKSLLKKN